MSLERYDENFGRLEMHASIKFHSMGKANHMLEMGVPGSALQFQKGSYLST